MTEIVLPLVQACLTASLAVWMAHGAWLNWRHPALNEEFVAAVMGLEGLEEEAPDVYSHVARRRVADRRLIRAAFQLIRLWETLVALVLAAGAALLAAAAFGAGPADAAQAVALVGATGFTLTWAAFLIGGDYFCYWYRYFSSQATHFLLAIWGTATIAVLAASG